MQNVDQSLIEEKIYSSLIDDVIFGLMLQMHRAAKLDYLFLFDSERDSLEDKEYELDDDNDVLGIFSGDNKMSSMSRNGQNSILLKYECVCPNCERSLAAIRFAPHLEKCMGMGRSSSRIATRRIANYNGGDDLDQLIEAAGLIPNPAYQKSTANQQQDDELMSIINAVATANSEGVNPSSSSSSLIDIEVSSSSSSSLSNNNQANLRPPSAKKKRLQPKLSKSNSANSTQNQMNKNSL